MGTVLARRTFPLSHKGLLFARRIGSQSAIGRLKAGVGLENARSAAGSRCSTWRHRIRRPIGTDRWSGTIGRAMTGNRREPLLLLLSAAALLLASHARMWRGC